MSTKKSLLSHGSLLPQDSCLQPPGARLLPRGSQPLSRSQMFTSDPVTVLPQFRHIRIYIDDLQGWLKRRDLSPTPLMVNRSNKATRSCWLWLEERLSCFCLECTIVILTFLNVLVITTELLIKLRIITVPSTQSSSKHNGDLPTSPYNNTSIVTEAGEDTSSTTPQDNQLTPTLRVAELVCHYLSISIVSFFLFEMSLKLLIKNKEFLQDRWQILDASVVIVSFTIELLITLIQPLPFYWELATYVLVLRLWRLGRMCNKKSGSWKREGEIEVFQSDVSRRKEEEHFMKLQYKLDKQEKEIKRLESMLRRYQVDNNIDSNRNNTETLSDVLESWTIDRYAESKSNTIITTATEEVSQLRQNKTTNGHVPNCQPIERQYSQDSRDSYNQSESETSIHYYNTPHLSRADSESSMSQDGGLAATVHNVHVNVEGGSEGQDSNNRITRDTCSTDGVAEEGPSGYTNQSFETDVSLDDRNWPVLSEIDGTKTYRSADGIPMTSL